ncbi:PREDICTED: zinc finger SWIM domain-containing protein 7 [Mandrillus leucophaeus]|uniref:zinc finger SWIM domain-containing protein 7 n=1 Tax=Mandrillus leucophaeus TaxID=9568 RepID=UPI0005F3AD86|nr:PREDICTED: zinc finger SWIM domain-containing protein 7 [Mandrillus leucophaeus]
MRQKRSTGTCCLFLQSDHTCSFILCGYVGSFRNLHTCCEIPKVLGSSGKTYTCLASCHYCSCPAFAFSVLRKSDSILCKHLLAVYLSQVMRTCQQLSVSDKQLTDILLMEKKQEA